MVSSGDIQHAHAQPSVMLVGAEFGTQTGLVEALSVRGLYVETVPVRRAQKAAMLTAPDLAVLVDEAVADDGVAVLDELASGSLSSAVPIVVLEENPSLEARIQAFRHGATAVLHRSTKTQEVARELAGLAREIVVRKSETYGELGEVTFREFLGALSSRLRANARLTSSDDCLPVAFAGGRPLVELVDDYVLQVRHHVPRVELLGYEFGESGSLACGWLAAGTFPMESLLVGLRVALADDDASRGASIARELQSRGATVLVTELNPSGQRFARLRQLDPTVLVIGADQLETTGHELLWRVQSDARLRWATLLVVSGWERCGPGPDQRALVEQLALRLLVLVAPEQELRARLFDGRGFDARLETMGPARLLYALVDPPSPVLLRIDVPRLRVQIDVSDRLLVGVEAVLEGEPKRCLEGIPALEAFLTLTFGRVHVEPVGQAAAANVMTSVQDALTLADRDENSRPAQQLPTKALVIGRSVVMASPIRRPNNASVPHASAPLGRGTSVRSRGLEPLEDVPDTAVAESRAHRIVANETKQDAPPDPGAILPGSTGFRAEVQEGPRSVGDAVPARAAEGPAGSRRRVLVLLVASMAALATCVVVLFVVGVGKGGVLFGLPRAEPDRAVRGAIRADIVTDGTRTGTPVEASTAANAGTRGAIAGQRPEDEQDWRIAKPSMSESLPVAHASNPPTPTCAELASDADDDPTGASSDASELIQMGRRLLVYGDANRAQRAYCRAVAVDPNNATAQAELARTLLIRRDGIAGLREVDRALELDPTNRVLHGVRGDALARLGRYEEARSEWLTEAQLQAATPSDERALFGAVLRGARGHLQRHAWGEAERYCRRAVVLEHESLDASMCLAKALSSLGDVDEARMWARHAHTLAPRSTRAAELLRVLGVEPSY